MSDKKQDQKSDDTTATATVGAQPAAPANPPVYEDAFFDNIQATMFMTFEKNPSLSNMEKAIACTGIVRTALS